MSGDADEMELTALVGRAVVDLKLMVSDAGEKGDALIELASTIASRLQ